MLISATHQSGLSYSLCFLLSRSRMLEICFSLLSCIFISSERIPFYLSYNRASDPGMHNLWGTNGLWMAEAIPGNVHTIFQGWTLFCEEGTQHSPDSYSDSWGQEPRTMDHPPLALWAPALDFHGHLCNVPMAQKRCCGTTERYEPRNGKLKMELGHHSMCLQWKRRPGKQMQGRVQGRRAGRLESVCESTWWHSEQNKGRDGRIMKDVI